jgi:hypothetical protein
MRKEVHVESVFKWLGIIGTCIVTAISTVFGLVHFAYSDFETQRTTDVYRGQIELRLDTIHGEVRQTREDMKSLNEKIDRLLTRR